MQKMSSFESVSSDGDICQSMCDNENDPYYEQNGQHYYTQLYPADAAQSQSGNRLLTEDAYWEDGSPCSSSQSNEQIECSPNNYINSTDNNNHNQSPYHHHYTQIYCSSHQQYDKNGFYCDETYYGATTTTNIGGNQVVRVIKRRTTANKKERRRTQSINSAYSCLRDRIPNVPSDTKLSKIKTLRLATSYISYLINVLEGEQEPSGFRAELVPSSRKINAERRAIIKNELQNSSMLDSPTASLRKKGRTGWPQAVWATTIK